MVLDVPQTIGICIGSVALVVIAISLFGLSARIGSFFMPFDLYNDEEEEEEELEIVEPPRKNRRPRRGQADG